EPLGCTLFSADSLRSRAAARRAPDGAFPRGANPRPTSPWLAHIRPDRTVASRGERDLFADISDFQSPVWRDGLFSTASPPAAARVNVWEFRPARKGGRVRSEERR